MKLFNKLLLYLFLHLFLLNCANPDPLTHFTSQQTEKIKPTRWIPLEDYGVLKPRVTIKYGDDYVIIDGTKENVITCVNFSTHKFVSGGNFGNGPNELNMIGQLRKVKEKLLINDISLQKIFEITIQDSSLFIKPYHDINYEKRLYFFDYLGDNVIAIGMFGDFWIGYINIFNNELLSKIDFPKFEQTNHLKGTLKSSVYSSSRVSISPNEKKVVVATQDAGIITLIDIGETELTAYRQIIYYPPGFSVVEIEGGGGRKGVTIATPKDSKVGFCGVDCDDKYIYVLYSGRTLNSHSELKNHCEHLLIYDWDGNPIKRYILDIPMWSMKYDKEKNSIYGIAYNPEGGFIEYQL